MNRKRQADKQAPRNYDSQELVKAKVGEEAVAIERVYFYKTDRLVNPAKESPFKYIPGTIPILISAPHAVRHVRKKEIKMSDEYTGSTACLLNKFTGCHVLTVTATYNEDPNYDSPSLYKDYLGEICRKARVALVLDLHGAARDREFAVDLGTMGGHSTLQIPWLPDLLEECLRTQGISPVSRDVFPARKQDTVTKFAAVELNLPAVQLEINKAYRVPRQNPHAYSQLLAALINAVKACSVRLTMR